MVVLMAAAWRDCIREGVCRSPVATASAPGEWPSWPAKVRQLMVKSALTPVVIYFLGGSWPAQLIQLAVVEERAKLVCFQ
jgi:hypothetical protein